MTKILGLLVWSCSVLLGTISAAADLRAGPQVLGDLEQPQVRLVGVVRDGTGAVLQAVSVTVSGDALPTSRAVVTNDLGADMSEKRRIAIAECVGFSAPLGNCSVAPDPFDGHCLADCRNR